MKMAIKIKYSLEGDVEPYNSFKEIQQLPNYNDIVYIDYSYNKLTELPEDLPQSLQHLNCSYNKIITIGSKLPASLQKLDCSNNKIITIESKLPTSLLELDCTNNKIIKFTSKFPQSLQKLNCFHNNLVELPEDLPQSLQKLYCGNNNLVELPEDLPQSLQKLNCFHNNLVELPEDLPQSLQKLYCGNNNLVELPEDLPQSLQRLSCGNNNLTKLPPNLPHFLQVLYCSNNQLTELPEDLPQSLQVLGCYNNKLISLPTNLHEYRNLTHCVYFENEIEYIPPHITRFLNQLSGLNDNVVKLYDDRQNVHNHQIQKSIRNSIYAVMKVKPSITTDEMCSELVANKVITEKTKRLLLEYCEDNSVHGVIGITFKELLRAVWNVLYGHKDSNEICAIMNTEIDDADCKCFTGKMSRLINCLNGYDSRVVITMAENDQIGNIIIIEKEKLEIEGRYDIESHKDNVRRAMEERKYPLNIIDEWSSYIE